MLAGSPVGTVGALAPSGCCHHPLAQAGSRAKLATSAGQGCRSDGTCAKPCHVPEPWLWVCIPWSPPALAAGTGPGNEAEMLCQALQGFWEPFCSAGCRILQCRPCSGHGRDGCGGASIYRVPGERGRVLLCRSGVPQLLHYGIGGSTCLWVHPGPLSPPSAAGTWTSTALGLCPTPRHCGKTHTGTTWGGVPGRWSPPRPSPDCALSSSHFQLPCDAGGRRQCACRRGGGERWGRALRAACRQGSRVGMLVFTACVREHAHVQSCLLMWALVHL